MVPHVGVQIDYRCMDGSLTGQRGENKHVEEAVVVDMWGRRQQASALVLNGFGFKAAVSLFVCFVWWETIFLQSIPFQKIWPTQKHIAIINTINKLITSFTLIYQYHTYQSIAALVVGASLSLSVFCISSHVLRFYWINVNMQPVPIEPRSCSRRMGFIWWAYSMSRVQIQLVRSFEARVWISTQSNYMFE